MRFDQVLDRETVLVRFVQVNADVALRIDNRGDTFRSDHVGSVRETGKIELFEVHPGS
jgi:hypothetical protein